MFHSIVEAVFHYANTQPDKICLIDDKGQVTYKEYAEKIVFRSIINGKLTVEFQHAVFFIKAYCYAGRVVRNGRSKAAC